VAQVRITRPAETDLLEGYVFYEQQQAGIGDYFLDSLYADIDALALYAGIHPKPDGRLHRTLAARFPFAIYYDLDGEIATVVAVLDCRQNPDSIVQRLGRT
jgi:plasmid stabilization system protein ParE